MFRSAQLKSPGVRTELGLGIAHVVAGGELEDGPVKEFTAWIDCSLDGGGGLAYGLSKRCNAALSFDIRV